MNPFLRHAPFAPPLERRQRTRRRLLGALPAGMVLGTLPAMPDPAHADASHPTLAAYYDRHAAVAGGVLWGWSGQQAPRRLLAGCTQAGVSDRAWLALREDGALLLLADDPAQAVVLRTGVARFACGASGWFAIDRERRLWQGRGQESAAVAVANDVVDACIGDSADYYVTADGRLWVRGLAHRGQYGDGRLTATPGYVSTAQDAVAVRAHTGHAIHLKRDGTVHGTGGNRYGPLSAHGLGDKADRWGPIFGGAVAIATGSRHSAAIRADGTLWLWGEGFTVQPAEAMREVAAVACGDTVTLAARRDGSLWQWDRGRPPRRLDLA